MTKDIEFSDSINDELQRLHNLLLRIIEDNEGGKRNGVANSVFALIENIHKVHFNGTSLHVKDCEKELESMDQYLGTEGDIPY